MQEEYTEDQAAEQAQVDETTEAIREAFDVAMSDEGATEDDIKMAMIAAGATFKNVTRLFNQFMIDAGLAISKEDRNQIVQETLEGREFATEEDFNDCVAALVEAITGANERSAASLIRAYAKKNELDVYAKPKSAGGGKVGFAGGYYDFLVGNPTKEQAEAYIDGVAPYGETSENVKRHKSHYLGVWDLANRIHNA